MELHRFLAIDELTLILLYYRLDAKELHIPTAWLCPNHHVLYHLLIHCNKEGGIEDWHIDGMTGEEIKRMGDLLDKIDRDKYREMLHQGVPIDRYGAPKKPELPKQMKLI